MNFESEASLEVAEGGPTVNAFVLGYNLLIDNVFLIGLNTNKYSERCKTEWPTVKEIFLVCKDFLIF